jgi:hypothetical protein
LRGRSVYSKQRGRYKINQNLVKVVLMHVVAA